MVILLERVSPSLRGELTRWLLEPRPGVFVGNVSALVRDKLWEYTCAKMGKGGGMLLHNADTEQGFAVRLWGTPDRIVRDFEGLALVTIPQEAG